MATANTDKQVVLQDGIFTEDTDISIHVAKGEGAPNVYEGMSVWGYNTDMAAVSDKMFEMIPHIDGQNEISPLEKEHVVKMLENVFKHAFRLGQLSGFESGYWTCDELYGCPIGEDNTEDMIKLFQSKYHDDMFGGSDVEDGWFAREWTLMNIPSDEIVKFSQRHWMNWKEGVTWIDECRQIAAIHRHISKLNTVHNPKEVFQQVLTLGNVFLIDNAEAIQYFHDALDVLLENGAFDEGDVSEYKHQISLDRLSTLRAGVPLDDIFA